MFRVYVKEIAFELSNGSDMYWVSRALTSDEAEIELEDDSLFVFEIKEFAADMLEEIVKFTFKVKIKTELFPSAGDHN